MIKARTTSPEGDAQNSNLVCPAAAPGPKRAGVGSEASEPDSPHPTPGTLLHARCSPLPRPASAAGPRTVGYGAERKLMSRVFERCHAAILGALEGDSKFKIQDSRAVRPESLAALEGDSKFKIQDSKIKIQDSRALPPEFLAALTANETGGNASAARFEPAVYRHLAAVAAGKSPAYGPIQVDRLLASLGRVVHPKADSFHSEYLTPLFAVRLGGSLSSLEDERLRELATSWGYTQIMGYHVLGRPAAVQRDSGFGRRVSGPEPRTVTDPKILLDSAIHFKVALELIADFCARFQLDPRREFEEMFRCWNTGQPYGATYDPHYAENGLRRMAIYAAISEESGIRSQESA